ncbi:hypothetical protein [Oscillibacter sp.]|uniref:hypothetical protein n=1 Tax=Oscillibacter sp. TaxID=1945593 RepID=UPI00260529BD|nr:hypothetical protein [Oscillibacter sp.]MDD3347404.1 hypothetical protein [Oscillibacter sp.]
MKSTWKTAFAKLQDNRGSSIIMVVVSMMFLSILGAALLYMSYTGYLIKVTDRHGKETFYDAAAAMTELQSGIQQVVSNSIAAAYDDMLVHYSDTAYTGANLTDKFHELFREEVFSWKSDPTDGDSALFPLRLGTHTCNTDVLKTFLTHPESTVLSAGAAQYDPVSDTMLLRDFQVSCTNPKTLLTSNVTSDLVIKMPDFYYLASEYSISGIPEFAVIARTALSQTIGNSQLNIKGSAYAGSMDLSGAQSSLSVTGGTLICRGDVSVKDEGPLSGASRLTVADNATLWANRINLNTAGSLSLNGKAYIADDLALEGDDASAAVGGSYYGFGQSLTDASQSSAILVNGKHTELDLSHAGRLMLAGHSFISDTASTIGAPSGQVLMGESLSVKSNQQAYLIPPAYLEGVALNPTVLAASDPIPAPTLTDAPLWTIGGTPMSLADYHITPKTVVLRRNGAGSQRIVYYFMEFASTADANQYFKDYFAANQGDISRYLKMYTDLSTLDGIAQTSGYVVYQSQEGYQLRGYAARDSLTTTSTQLTTMFRQLGQTLSVNPVTTSARDPYEYIVNTDKLARELSPGSRKWFDVDGDVLGLVVNDSYTITDSTPSSLRVILASGDVQVSRDFRGLIVSGGAITMEKSVYASEEGVVSAFSATNGDLKFGDFLNDAIGSGGHTESTGNLGSWKLDGLVSFQNWLKH